jgi:hypothetical protein
MILDFYQSPDFQIYPLDNTDGIYYSNWNYIRPLDILTDGFKYSFGKFNDASRYCPIYFKFYETNPNERSFYLGRHPFVSGHELLKKLYPYWPENSIVILVNVNFIDNTDEFNNVQLQGTIAHEIEHGRRDLSDPNASVLLKKPYGLSKFFTHMTFNPKSNTKPINRLGISDAAQQICHDICYILSKEEREAKIIELKTALEGYLENEKTMSYIIQKFDSVTKDEWVKGKIENPVDTMFKVLLRSKMTYSIHDLRRIYIYIARLVGTSDQEFQDRITKSVNNMMDSDDVRQALLALGYAFWKYDMLKYDIPGTVYANKENAVDIFGNPEYRQLIKDPKRLRANNNNFNNFLKFIRDNVKAAILDYANEIYDTIADYVPEFLRMMGARGNDIDDIRPKYPVDSIDLEMIKENLKIHADPNYFLLHGIPHRHGHMLWLEVFKNYKNC